MTAQEAQEAVDNLEIGGRNYILNSSSEISDSTALIARYALSEAMVAGDEYTISLTLTPMESYEGLTVRTSGGDKTLATIDLSGVGRQIVQATFIAEYASGKSPDDDPDNGDILIYRKPASAGTASWKRATGRRTGLQHPKTRKKCWSRSYPLFVRRSARRRTASAQKCRLPMRWPAI